MKECLSEAELVQAAEAPEAATSRHLAQCLDCSAEVGRLAAVSQRLRQLRVSPASNDRFQDQVIGAIRQERRVLRALGLVRAAAAAAVIGALTALLSGIALFQMALATGAPAVMPPGFLGQVGTATPILEFVLVGLCTLALLTTLMATVIVLFDLGRRDNGGRTGS